MKSKNPEARPAPVWFWPLLGLLVVLESAWLYWFLREPLPNAANVGGEVRRWVLLSRALPEVVPGVRFGQSHLGLALRELSDVEYLPQRVPIVLGAALIVAAAWALGHLVLRILGLRADLAPRERSPLALGLGLSGLALLTLIAGRLGGLAPWPVRLALVGMVGLEIGCRCAVRSSGRISGDGEGIGAGRLVGFVLVAGPFLGLMALGAMLPTIDFDALEYHLQGPKEYYQDGGRISFLSHNVYTSMPFGVEMLHLLGMLVLDDWWWGALVGQLVVMLHAPAAAAMIALTARRWASPRAAWVAAVVYLTTPWVFRLAAIPYVEGPLAFYHAALVWAVSWAIGPQSSAPRAWGIVGALAGGAMACKYPALISAVLPFGAVALVAAWRQRSPAIALAFGVGVAVVIGPWLIKNVIDTGNPVYPLAYGVFGGRHWDAASDAKWSAAHGPRPIALDALGASLVDVAGRSDWQSPLFTALAPLALLRSGSRRFALVLWAYVLYLFATWWLLTHRLDRFWLPMLPALAVLAGLGADWSRRRSWTVVLGLMLALAITTNLTYCSTALVGLNRWTADLNALRREVPAMLNPALAGLDADLPPDAKLLLVGQASVFHLRHPIVYNTVFDHETIELLARDRSAEQVRRELGRRGITHVYVDWFEIDRYRSPGNYGFTAFVTPEVFDGLVRDGVLERLPAPGPNRELYRVR